MKPRNAWLVIVIAVVLAIYGSIWHPTPLQTIGIGMVFLFLIGFFYFSDRIDRLEEKLDAISQRK